VEISVKALRQWQLWAQHLTSPVPPQQAASDLCGLQAQYAANALHSLRLRSESTNISGFVKAWTLRGTLHLFPVADLPLYLPDAGGIESIFDTGYGKWLYDGHCSVSKERMLFFARLVADALSDAPVSREQLRALCRDGGMTEEEEERVFSGWGGVIRLLAESGVLCVSAQVNRAYCRCPALPAVSKEQAHLELMRRYVTHYGPVTLHDAMYFFRWPQKNIRQLLEQLDCKALICQGHTYYYKVQPDFLPPIPRCVFLAGFDPLMLGYEKKESPYLPAQTIKQIFNNTGIVFPALLVDGQVKGKWKEQPKRIEVTLFDDLNKIQTRAMERECARLWPEKPLKLL